MSALRHIFTVACVWMATACGPAPAQQPGAGAPKRAGEQPSNQAAPASPWQPYFRQLAAEYRMTVAKGDKQLALVEDPLLKWSQPVRGGADGAVFLWLEDGRPAVIGTFFIWPADNNRQGLAHELYVLANDQVDGDWRQTMRWRPRESPIVWKAVPEAPIPAKAQAARLIDARQLARRFAATSRKRDGQSWELRLQPRPFFQYEAKVQGADWLGGALFSIVQGTDTEVVLWLEAQRVNGAYEWRYACARMSDLELRVTLDGMEVWTTQRARYNDLAGSYLSTTPEFFREPPAPAASASHP